MLRLGRSDLIGETLSDLIQLLLEHKKLFACGNLTQAVLSGEKRFIIALLNEWRMITMKRNETKIQMILQDDFYTQISFTSDRSGIDVKY